MAGPADSKICIVTLINDHIISKSESMLILMWNTEEWCVESMLILMWNTGRRGVSKGNIMYTLWCRTHNDISYIYIRICRDIDAHLLQVIHITMFYKTTQVCISVLLMCTALVWACLFCSDTFWMWWVLWELCCFC